MRRQVGVRNPPDPEDPDGPNVIYVSQEELVAFIRTVYFLSLVFMAVEIIQWLILTTNNEWNQTVRAFGLGFFITALIALSLLNCCPPLRYAFPWNWIMTVIIIECITLGVGAWIHSSIIQNVFYTVLIAALITVTLLVFGIVCPTVILPGELCICCIQCIFFIALIVMFTIIVVSDFGKHVRNFLVVSMVLLVPIVLYHSQVIHGRRYGIPIKDHLLCSIMLTMDFTLFTVGIYYLLFVSSNQAY